MSSKSAENPENPNKPAIICYNSASKEVSYDLPTEVSGGGCKRPLRIVHWNTGGLGQHGWDRGAILYFFLKVKADIVLLSETKRIKCLPRWINYTSYTLPHCHSPVDGKAMRGLTILCRESTTKRRVMNVRGDRKFEDGKPVFEYLSVDIQEFSNYDRLHRVIVVYNDSPGNLANVKTGFESDDGFLHKGEGVQFVHVLGDFNFANDSNRKDLADYMSGKGFQLLLEKPSHVISQHKLDLIFSKAQPEVSVDHMSSVLVHKPFEPHQALLDAGDLQVGAHDHPSRETCPQQLEYKYAFPFQLETEGPVVSFDTLTDEEMQHLDQYSLEKMKKQQQFKLANENLRAIKWRIHKGEEWKIVDLDDKVRKQMDSNHLQKMRENQGVKRSEELKIPKLQYRYMETHRTASHYPEDHLALMMDIGEKQNKSGNFECKALRGGKCKGTCEL